MGRFSGSRATMPSFWRHWELRSFFFVTPGFFPVPLHPLHWVFNPKKPPYLPEPLHLEHKLYLTRQSVHGRTSSLHSSHAPGSRFVPPHLIQDVFWWCFTTHRVHSVNGNTILSWDFSKFSWKLVGILVTSDAECVALVNQGIHYRYIHIIGSYDPPPLPVNPVWPLPLVSRDGILEDLRRIIIHYF